LSPGHDLASSPGVRSGHFSPIAPKRSSFPPTPCLSRRCAILSACTCRRPNARWFCASTKRARSRRWTDLSRCFPCARDKSSGAPTDYTRHGTLTLFAALDAATGKVIGRCYPRHRGREFLSFLREIERNVPPELEVRLIMDNYATHKTQAIRKWLGARSRWHVHFTPTASSWVNLVERFFAAITEKQIRRPSLHQRTGNGDPILHRGGQRGSKALPLDPIRRPYPHRHKTLLPQIARNRRSPNRNRTKLRIRTLGGFLMSVRSDPHRKPTIGFQS
jgi:hypothetical protein